MSNDKKPQTSPVFEQIEGCVPVKLEDVQPFITSMNNDVIPEIVKVVEERRMLASDSRHWKLKC
jgi:hypothetical protein